ncbi:MAG: NADH:ubiquinone reductase (Na(+)-transporting) subunit D [Bacteroidetes bacterium]|nr:NADH:ubiquinone reductase (Na(+)-transporting) subunit D [Bacteroidota bacterium]
MSAETETIEQAEVQEVKVKKKTEPLFSKRRKRLVTDPLDESNPVTVQVLGICSALAITTQMKPTVVMAISVVAVIVFSNLLISLIRNLIPMRVRMIVELAIVATFVILVDQILKAYLYDISKVLSVFVGLIITNCIVMGRLEAFAMANKPWESILDGFGSGFGYAWIILAVAFFREVFGSGKLFGFQIIPEFIYNSGFVNNGLMVSPVGAFIILGIIIWVQRTRNGYVEQN